MTLTGRWNRLMIAYHTPRL